jgi:predicted ArsR family transcriptional regulator
MAEEVGQEYGRLMAASLGDGARGQAGEETQRSFRSALHIVADALTAHGFAAHAEKHGDALRIVSEHCPFGDAAIENPVICAVDRGMVHGMLSALYGDTSAELAASVALGDDVCVTSVEA